MTATWEGSANTPATKICWWLAHCPAAPEGHAAWGPHAPRGTSCRWLCHLPKQRHLHSPWWPGAHAAGKTLQHSSTQRASSYTRRGQKRWWWLSFAFLLGWPESGCSPSSDQSWKKKNVQPVTFARTQACWAVGRHLAQSTGWGGENHCMDATCRWTSLPCGPERGGPLDDPVLLQLLKLHHQFLASFWSLVATSIAA